MVFTQLQAGKTGCVLQGIDTDHSGTITVEELKAGMKKAGSPVALAELQGLLAHIDVDQNGTISSPVVLAS